MSNIFKAEPKTYGSLWTALLENSTFKETFIQCMKNNIESKASLSFIKRLPNIICSDNALFIEVLTNAYLMPLNIKKLLEISQSSHTYTFWKCIFTIAIFTLILIGILIILLKD